MKDGLLIITVDNINLMSGNTYNAVVCLNIERKVTLDLYGKISRQYDLIHE